MDMEFFRDFALAAAATVGVTWLLFAVMETSGVGPGIFVLVLVVAGISAAGGSGPGKKGGPGDGGGAEDHPFDGG